MSHHQSAPKITICNTYPVHAGTVVGLFVLRKIFVIGPAFQFERHQLRPTFHPIFTIFGAAAFHVRFRYIYEARIRFLCHAIRLGGQTTAKVTE